MELGSLPSVRDAGDTSFALLARNIERRLSQFRAGHPISILDLSPGEQTGIELALWLRSLNRKVRLMTYEWVQRKSRDSYGGPPEVLVEKGQLPGLHFSPGSFDYVLGVDVLRDLASPLRCRVLGEIARTALREAVLVEASLTRADVEDSLVQIGAPRAQLTPEGGLLVIELARSAAASR